MTIPVSSQVRSMADVFSQCLVAQIRLPAASFLACLAQKCACSHAFRGRDVSPLDGGHEERG